MLRLEDTLSFVLPYQNEQDSKNISVVKQHPKKRVVPTMKSMDNWENGLIRNIGSCMRLGRFRTALLSVLANGMVKSNTGSRSLLFNHVESAILYCLLAVRPVTPIVTNCF